MLVKLKTKISFFCLHAVYVFLSIYFRYLAAQSVLMLTLFSDFASLMLGSFEYGKCWRLFNVSALLPVTPLARTYREASLVWWGFDSGFATDSPFPPKPPKSGRLLNDGMYLLPPPPNWRCFLNPVWPFSGTPFTPGAAT